MPSCPVAAAKFSIWPNWCTAGLCWQISTVNEQKIYKIKFFSSEYVYLRFLWIREFIYHQSWTRAFFYLRACALTLLGANLPARTYIDIDILCIYICNYAYIYIYIYKHIMGQPKRDIQNRARRTG
jgi:hypothetical protein